jgi:methyl-accepting chemotaxis protein
MKWFYNLSIAKKLIYSFLLIAFFTACMGTTAILNLRTLAKQDKYMYDNCVLSLQSLGSALAKYERINAIMRDQLLTADKSFADQRSQDWNKLIGEMNQNVSEYEKNIDAPDEKELYDNYQKEVNAFTELASKFDNLVKNGNNSDATVLLNGDLNKARKSTRSALEKVFEYNIDDAKNISDSNDNKASNTIWFMTFIVLLVIAISIALGTFLSKVIKSSITKVLDMAREMMKGHTKARVNLDTDDELGEMGRTLDLFVAYLDESVIGSFQKVGQGQVDFTLKPADSQDEIASAVNKVTTNIRSLITETKMLTKTVVDGKLSYRSDSEKFSGSYREIIEEINEVLDAAINPLNMAAEYVDRLSKGSIPEAIKDNYKGDFNEIKININSLIQTFTGFVEAQKEMADKHAEGWIDEQIDSDKFPGIYGHMAKSINELVKSHIDVKMKVVEVVSRYAVGDFSVDMDKLPGKKALITEAIDNVKASLNGINSEIVNIAEAALRGDLKYRGDEQKFQHSFRDMVAGINKTLETIVNPLYMTANYLDKIGKGEIPEKITEEYKGDFNNIKISINSCIQGLDGLREASGVLTLMAQNDYTKNVSGTSLGIYASMRESVNKVLLRLNAVQNVLIQISNGDLGKLEFYKSVGKSCENDKLVPSLVVMMSSIKALVDDVNGLTVSALNGNLSERADITKHKGNFKDIIEGVNKTLDAVVTPLIMAAEYVDKISKGDIPEKITETYNGDINTIKDNLNTCIEAINSLIYDVNNQADAAVDGRLSVRAEASKHSGDYRKIITGLNNTLDAVIIPINEGVEYLGKMAEGNLTLKITSDYKGDHQLIKNSINTVADSLNKALGEVRDAIEATASASNQISSSTEEMAAGSQEQTQQATEVAGGVEEMTRTILENTKNASVATGAAKEAGDKAKIGGTVVSETIEEMNKIADVVKKSAETVLELGKSSNEIGEIIQVIDDIADQTNLLALNAAIEAARAGEQGRGFAVVADEVRKLAERTSKATKEIATMIKQIQKDTNIAVDSMEEGTTQVEKGKTLAYKAGESLTEIVAGTERVVDIVMQVAAASEEQSSAAEQISKNIEAISSVTQETASGNQQIAHAAEDLSRLTLNLQNLISRFQLSDDNAKELVIKNRNAIQR